MKVVLFCGGMGPRMREFSETIPKPLVNIGPRPIVWNPMRYYAHFGHTDFILCLGYKGEMIKEYFLNYEAWNNDFTVELGRKDSLMFHDEHDESHWTVTVAFTGETTMTGGRVFRAAKYLDDEPFLVTYGDGLADVDVEALTGFHQRSECLATVTTVQPTSRFGVMDVATDGRVISFSEKPHLEGWINVGFFIMRPDVLQYLDRDCVLEEEPLASLARDGQLSAYRHRGFWQPMDTFREAKLLNDLWNSGKAPWRIW